MIVDKFFFHGGKTKSIFENLIFPQRDFVCWWNLRLNVPDYLNPFMTSGNKKSYILKYVQPFVPLGAKALRKWNICETKKVCELDHEK